MSPDNLTPEELIRTPEEILREFRIIFDLEKKAAEIYQQLAQDCEHPEIRIALENISMEERVHMKVAKKLVQIVEKKIRVSKDIK